MEQKESNFNKLLKVVKYEWDSYYDSGETQLKCYFEKDLRDNLHIYVDFDKSWRFKIHQPNMNNNFSEYQLEIMSEMFGSLIKHVVDFIDERRVEIIDKSIKDKPIDFISLQDELNKRQQTVVVDFSNYKQHPHGASGINEKDGEYDKIIN